MIAPDASQPRIGSDEPLNTVGSGDGTIGCSVEGTAHPSPEPFTGAADPELVGDAPGGGEPPSPGAELGEGVVFPDPGLDGGDTGDGFGHGIEEGEGLFTSGGGKTGDRLDPGGEDEGIAGGGVLSTGPEEGGLVHTNAVGGTADSA